MSRSRFRGFIAGVGSTSGVRVVLGHWPTTPLGAFSDAMVETEAGWRVLLAPRADVAAFIAETYVFDEVRIESFAVDATSTAWAVRSPSLRMDLRVGPRTPLGVALRAVPSRLAEAPAWSALTDPVARVLLKGVRTRGVASEGRREWYGATDVRAVTSLSGDFEDTDLGTLAPVDPPCRFGFSSTPRRPAVTTVVTTVDS